MEILLVRHATAGKRQKWEGEDRIRPLDDRGRRQAEGLADVLAAYPGRRIYSSPYVRCRDTVAPLARVLGIPVEDRDELAEGAGGRGVLSLADELAPPAAVLCTHGDVVAALLGEQSKKGSTWVLEVGGGRVTRRQYLPPPA